MAVTTTDSERLVSLVELAAALGCADASVHVPGTEIVSDFAGRPCVRESVAAETVRRVRADEFRRFDGHRAWEAWTLDRQRRRVEAGRAAAGQMWNSSRPSERGLSRGFTGPDGTQSGPLIRGRYIDERLQDRMRSAWEKAVEKFDRDVPDLDFESWLVKTPEGREFS